MLFGNVMVAYRKSETRLPWSRHANADVWVRFPSVNNSYAIVAQLVEHLPEEQGVGGSTPSGGT